MKEKKEKKMKKKKRKMKKEKKTKWRIKSNIFCSQFYFFFKV